MRSSRSSLPSGPCPCGGVCDCHRPDESNFFWTFLILMVALVFVLGGACLFAPTVAPKTIRVGEKVCGVRFVKTGVSCTSTGFCHDRGYDEAVCPKEGP